MPARNDQNVEYAGLLILSDSARSMKERSPRSIAHSTRKQAADALASALPRSRPHAAQARLDRNPLGVKRRGNDPSAVSWPVQGPERITPWKALRIAARSSMVAKWSFYIDLVCVQLARVVARVAWRKKTSGTHESSEKIRAGKSFS